MNLENRFPKHVRDRAKEITQGYRSPTGSTNTEKMARAKKQLEKRQKAHPDWVVYFDTLPEAVRFIRDRISQEKPWIEHSLVAPMDKPGEFGYCAVAGGAGMAESIWAGRRLVAHEADLTKEVLDAFLDGLDTDTIEEV